MHNKETWEDISNIKEEKEIIKMNQLEVLGMKM